jgi:hypothetical protein
MRVWNGLILLSLLFNISCSGVVINRTINIIKDKSDLNVDVFINSFSDILQKNGYSVKIIQPEDRDKNDNSVKNEHGTFPILLEAKKESFSISLTVRVCDNLAEGIFVQLVQWTFLKKEPEKNYNVEYNKICQILNNEYPNLRFDCGY